MAEMKEWGPRTLTGTDVTRLEAADKVTGRAKYTYDVNLPGMLFGMILRSPHAHAEVAGVDLTRAEGHPAVKAVLNFDKKTVRYAGEEVAAVAATSPEAATDALKLIDVTYRELPFAVKEETSMAPDAPQIHPRGNVEVNERRQRQRGDIDKGFAEAAATIEQTYSVPVQTHCSLETHGAVARWDGYNLTVWCSTQGIVGVRDDLAKLFEIPSHRVRVICQHMGGGFGSKFGAGVEGVAAARLARLAGRPVRLMLSRKEEQLCAGNRPSAVMKIRMGATKDGKLTAFHSSTYGTGGVGGVGNIPLPYVYSVPNLKADLQDVHINAGAARAMRAPGHPQAAFGMDCAMDELAEALGMDPLDLRRRNDSFQNEIRLKQYDIGAKRIGWERRSVPAGSGSGPVKRGIGMGCGLWGGGGGKGTFVEVTLHPDGSVDARSAVQDLGTGTRTILAMTVAEELGLSMQDVRSHIGDTDFPPGTGSGGSRTAASLVPAAKTAAREAKRKLFSYVAPILGAEATALQARDGRIQVKGNGKSWPWRDVVGQLGAHPVVVTMERDDGYNGNGVAGVHFVEVEVDTGTGRVQPIKVVAVHDCGLVVDRLLAESQVIGGVIGGISYALLEDRVLDEATGNVVNPNLEAYKLAGAYEMPEIEAVMMDMPERGVIGLGEPPAIPITGAMANAVYNAIGARLREFPLTPDKVLAALGKV